MQLSPAGGNLRVVHLPTWNGSQETLNPLLEFVIHNGAGQYDKAPDSEHCPSADLAVSLPKTIVIHAELFADDPLLTQTACQNLHYKLCDQSSIQRLAKHLLIVPKVN